MNPVIFQNEWLYIRRLDYYGEDYNWAVYSADKDVEIARIKTRNELAHFIETIEALANGAQMKAIRENKPVPPPRITPTPTIKDKTLVEDDANVPVF